MNVCLKEWTPEDVPIFADLINKLDRSYTSNRLPDPFTLKDAEEWIAKANREEGKSSVCRAIVADGEYIGNITVNQGSDIGIADAEIGYFIVKERWSQGITTEAVRIICDLAFEALDIERLTAYVFAPNKASVTVLERNGFSLEGTMKRAIKKYGVIYDQLLYGKCR